VTHDAPAVSVEPQIAASGTPIARNASHVDGAIVEPLQHARSSRVSQRRRSASSARRCSTQRAQPDGRSNASVGRDLGAQPRRAGEMLRGRLAVVDVQRSGMPQRDSEHHVAAECPAPRLRVDDHRRMPFEKGPRLREPLQHRADSSRA